MGGHFYFRKTSKLESTCAVPANYLTCEGEREGKTTQERQE